MAERTKDAPSAAEEGEDEESERPVVPEGVLRGIDDIEAGDTASKDDIEDVLTF